jgi:hypothetical protein
MLKKREEKEGELTGVLMLKDVVQAKEQVRQLMHGKSNSKNNIKLQIVSVTSHLALGEIDQFALLAWLIKVDRTL